MRKFNLKPDPQDLRDIRFRTASLKSVQQLPPNVDLRPEIPLPVKDQGDIGSCVFNAAMAAREYEASKYIRPWKNPYSRLYPYWHYRDVYEGGTEEDTGANIRNALKILYDFGTPLEIWHDYGDLRKTPSKIAEGSAWTGKISEYRRLFNLTDMKASLVEGYPIIFGMHIHRSFDEVDESGRVPVPDLVTEDSYGAHAMLIVGYDDEMGCVIVQNSWGPEWGDRGYCYIPYKMMFYPYTFDYWVITADPAKRSLNDGE